MAGYFKSECPAGSDDFEGCSSCRRTNAELYKNNSWIITWVDSIGKMPSGISDGNYHWLGDYEQCRFLKENKTFNGRYCSIQFEVPDTVNNVECDVNQPLEVHLGICLPASCSNEELKELAEFAADHEMNVHCEPPQQWPISSLIFLGCMIIWVAIILSASVIHSQTWNANSTLKLLIEALSLQRNVRASLRTKNHSTHFGAVHGLQVISLMLLIFGSNFFLIMPYLENVGFSYQSIESFYMQPIVNYSFYIDGLLALGALKFALKPLNEFKTMKLLLQHGARRLLRFWPAYAFVTVFMTFLYVRLGEGPMWSLNDLPARCESSWWANLLLINNLLGIVKTCLDGGFLFALEAQFLIVALVAFGLANRNKFAVKWTLIGILLVSVIYTFSISLYYQTFATLIPTASDFNSTDAYSNFVNNIYLNPFSRIGPYIIGLIFPLFFKCSHETTSGNSPMLTLSIFLLFIVGTFVVIWTPLLLEGSHLFLLFSFYAALHRCIWAVMMLSLAYVFNNVDKKNAINAILSWRIFYPLSKLVYVVFLISEPVALSLFSSLHRPIYATHFSTMLTGVGTIVCSYFLAFLVDVFISRPIRHLCLIYYEPKPEAV
uniref:Nose resistant-to-fluoxetine protein N-terminal domain-containing protein n=1 Tax=Acrobeloides nanus TaxID=290746 RepID=A0A914DYA0_9BILA